MEKCDATAAWQEDIEESRVNASGRKAWVKWHVRESLLEIDLDELRLESYFERMLWKTRVSHFVAQDAEHRAVSEADWRLIRKV